MSSNEKYGDDDVKKVGNLPWRVSWAESTRAVGSAVHRAGRIVRSADAQSRKVGGGGAARCVFCPRGGGIERDSTDLGLRQSQSANRDDSRPSSVLSGFSWFVSFQRRLIVATLLGL